MLDPEAGFPSVSRETSDKLSRYVELLLKWTDRINLISPSTKHDVWNRHIADSVQLASFRTDGDSWVDLGSGGGLPGLVVAVILHEQSPKPRITLVESDRRKCAFLRTAVRELELAVDIINERVENVPSMEANIISARALAPLHKLLGFGAFHGAIASSCLFLKGQNYREELEAARQNWSFDCKEHPSTTQTGSMILEITNLSERKVTP